MSMAFLTVPLQRMVNRAARGTHRRRGDGRARLCGRAVRYPRSRCRRDLQLCREALENRFYGRLGHLATLMLTIAIIAGVGGWITEYLGMAFGLALPLVGVVDLCGGECVVLYLLSYFDVRISTKRSWS